jgi:CIC family chloride channel protein
MFDRAAFRRSETWYQLQVRGRRLFNRVPLTESQKVYILTLLIGVIGGLAAVSFHRLLDFFQDHIIYRAAEVEGWLRVPLLILIPALGGLIAGAGLYFLAPEARGSGIPQVKTAFYLGGGRIPARVIPGRLFLSSFNIGTGASLGREGPTVQLSAALASLLGRMFAISRRRLQSLLPVGAAAGLAAAFNTPIAAVTFVLEEVLGDTSIRPLGSIVIASVIASVIERSMLGPQPLFDVPAYQLNRPLELVYYSLLGVASGVVATAFNEGLLRLRAKFSGQNRVPQWATPAVGGLFVGVTGLAGLLLTGSSSIFGIGYSELAKELKGGLALKVLIVLLAGKLIASVISYSSGSTGGIFGPSLYLGGMTGGIIGILAKFMLHDPAVQPGAFALVGMGAVFAGIVRAPVTSIVIIFEMTNNYSIILPLMVANIASYVLSTKLSPRPIYEALLMQDGIHLPHEQKHVLRTILVGDAMTRTVVTISGQLTAAEAFQHAQRLPEYHHAYPVVDGEGKIVGIITFNDLKRALAAGKSDVRLDKLQIRGIIHAHPDHTLEQIIFKLGHEGISQLPVVSRKDTSKLLGIISMDDITQALSNEGEDAAADETEDDELSGDSCSDHAPPHSKP